MDTSDETWTPFNFLFERISIETIAKEEEEEKKNRRVGTEHCSWRLGSARRRGSRWPRFFREHLMVQKSINTSSTTDESEMHSKSLIGDDRPTSHKMVKAEWKKKLSAYWRRGHRAESIITPTGRPAASRIPSFFSACLHKYQICVCRELKPKRTREKKEIKVTKAVLYRTSLVINM